MSKDTRKAQLSVNHAFLLFVLLSLLLSVVVSAVLVGYTTDNNMRQYHSKTAQTEAQLSARYVQQFLETRLQLLHDLAKQPMLINGVMGSDISTASLSDYLDTYQIVGNKEPIWMINIANELVYSNTNQIPFELDSVWLEKLLLDENRHAVSLIEQQGVANFLLGVPIKYNEMSEGALVVSFKPSLNLLLKDVINSDTYAVTLTGDWLEFSTIDNSLEYQSVSSYMLGDSGLTLDYKFNSQLVEQKVMNVIGKIASAIVASLVIAWIVLYLIGHKLLLDPYRRLAQSERAIKQSEERFKVAVKGSNDGLWDWDLTKDSVFYSPRFRELIGYEGDDEKAFPSTLTSFENALHPDDKVRVDECIKQHLQHNTPYDIEYRLQNKDGSYRFYRAKGTALRDAKGNPTRMAGSLTDITIQKRDQDALKAAKERNDLLAQAIEACNLGITISDAKAPDMPLIFLNSGFTKITGYGQEVIGTNCRFLQGDKTSQKAVGKIRTALNEKSKLRVELVNYRKDGKQFWNSLQISPVLDDNKELVAFVGIQQDVTERIETNKALEQAKLQAEHANKAKSEFLASMSHEIRTPMNGVLGMLNLLQNSDLSKEQLHRTNVAISSANALLNLLNDILDFSKIDAGKLELESLEFDLRAMLGEFAEAAAIQAHQKKLELVLDITNVHTKAVKGDPNRLRQILHNLVGNAIKFTAHGEVVIKASLTEYDDAFLQLQCEISDTGIGISAQQQEKLFKSFSQVDASTTRKYGGTGLGLAIVKKLCTLMDGDISVQSEFGKGCCFKFSILLGKIQSEFGKGCCFKFSILLGKSDSLQADIPTVDISKLTILIVDDNKTNLDVLRGQLEFWGATVIEAMSAEQAIEVCEEYYDAHQKCFDIAFLDMQMPDVDGAQLGQMIKQHVNLHATKLIMMTSMNHQGDANFFANLGFSGYFPKPATTSDLLDALAIVEEGGAAFKQANPLVTRHYIQALQTKHSDELIDWDSQIRILLAEDNQVNQIVAQSTLNKLGLMDITIAENGQDAISTLSACNNEKPFTLVLMDCQMPEMDGYDATNAIRRGEAGSFYQKIPIIAMTANAMVGDKEKCLAAGMDDYISKPIVETNLLNKLLTWLPHQSQAPE
ncbi:response regulator [Pseudoalteromonas sp. G4]|uniref:response regulator n=1 Tax=Pseudoalteromonas sp. G4 TaxID=2992761 RepID=UPI00237E87A7|nr:response regulator [Pseudoalteromonas sp. G4]MDE3271401.1 response regulator [Pseudoalteromonas sp. G4]